MKRAPWQIAFTEWHDDQDGRPDLRSTWQAAVEWCVEQIECVQCDDRQAYVIVEARRRIMGQEQQL